MRLVLFDIDGTLLDCGGQPRPILMSVLREVFGAGDVDGYSFAGRTDDQIVTELMRANGVAEGEIAAALPRVRELYAERLESRLEVSGMRLLPGVAALLDTLSQRRDLALGLLTGNWRAGARIKLSRLRLEGFFPFGAFGDDAADRRRLPPVALARATEHHGRRFRRHETLIVGDSPLDVECARAHGITCLAVATGRSTMAELSAAGADWVTPDLLTAASHPALGC